METCGAQPTPSLCLWESHNPFQAHPLLQGIPLTPTHVSYTDQADGSASGRPHSTAHHRLPAGGGAGPNDYLTEPSVRGGSPHQTPLQHLSAGTTTTTTTLPCGGPAGEGQKACHQHPRRGDAAKNTSKSYLPEGVAGDTRCTASPLNHCRRG